MGESHEEMLRHYEPGGLLPRIVAGLQALGKNLDSVTHEDLAPADEFHSAGRSATRALVELAKIPIAPAFRRVRPWSFRSPRPASTWCGRYKCR